MRVVRKKKGLSKLNLIPILDAVFIFIFFLLMSAQFVETYELEASTPQISEIEANDPKEPLNLTIKLTKKTISIHTGTNSTQLISKKWNGVDVPSDIKNKLIEIKSKHPKEETAILSVSPKVKYSGVIKTLEAAKYTTKNGIPVDLFKAITFSN